MGFLKKIIAEFKGNIPFVIKELVKFYTKRLRKNVFNTVLEKKSLLVYITDPFKNNSNAEIMHTNHYEALYIAECLNELCYSVDVCDFNQRYSLKYDEYDLIIGFGWALEDALKKGYEGKTVLYATGHHFEKNLTLVFGRAVNTYAENKSLKLYRVPEYNLFFQNNFTTGVICLGDAERAKIFETYKNRIVKNVYLPIYIKDMHLENISSNSLTERKKSFLWFGSVGIYHKGFDLLLLFFNDHPELDLHICGNISSDLNDLGEKYHRILEKDNIFYHGYISNSSEEFNLILKKCLFTILPSCSEGMSGALLTCILNGKLIPVSSNYVGINLDKNLVIENLTLNDVSQTILNLVNLDDKVLFSYREKYYNYFFSYCNERSFKKRVKKLLGDI